MIYLFQLVLSLPLIIVNFYFILSHVHINPIIIEEFEVEHIFLISKDGL